MNGGELTLTCSSCSNRTALRRVADGLEGAVKVTECVVCDRARCPDCADLVPGTARFCPTCGRYLFLGQVPGVDEDDPLRIRMLEIAGMRHCIHCRSYVDEHEHICAEAA